ncbi:MAG: TIGR03960 family B12-binding radical SAM protein [Bacillota bacterium]
MAEVFSKIDDELINIDSPERYIGREWNQIIKDWDSTSYKVCIGYPDTYEIGMSHLGLKIIYHLLNARSDMLCERVFSPWLDMEELLREKDLGLYSLENKRELKDFDLLGFTLQYEMSYTTILNMLDLGKIPVFAQDRNQDDPFVMAGGATVFNPEPLAPFVDFFYIGEAEAGLIEVLERLKHWQQIGGERQVILENLAALDGIYVPSLYEEQYEGQQFGGLKPKIPEAPDVIKRRFVEDLNDAFCPTDYIVPYKDIVHERAVIEVARGCQRGCRFCAAGMTYRPTRERSVDKIIELADKTLAGTGYDELALSSLSTVDHSRIQEMVERISARYSSSHISISLPSLRVDEFSVEMAKNVQKVRRSGLTFAPEAGSERLRKLINKGIDEEDLFKAVSAAFSSGWHRIKLYFMLGLPGEEEDDLAGIARLANKTLEIGQEIRRNTSQKMKRIEVHVNVTTFVPKPFTPFQWVKMASEEEMEAKIKFLQQNIKKRGIKFDWNEPKISRLEGLLARGDRRLADVVYQVWQQGSRLEGWSEQIHSERWTQALKDNNVEVENILGEKELDAVLPWDHLLPGVDKKFLQQEWQQAQMGRQTPDCRWDYCSDCGICVTPYSALCLDNEQVVR